MQVRCLVDVPGDKLPSASSGALQEHLERVVAPQVPEQLRASFLQVSSALAAGLSVHVASASGCPSA